MLAFIIVWITSYFNNLLALNEKIKGRWHLYLWNWFCLKKYRKSYPRGRLDLHDCFKCDLANVGFIPFPEEYQYANPKKNQSEDLFILATNTGEKSTLQVNFKRRPVQLEQTDSSNASKDQVFVSFKLRDNDGNTYSMEEKSVVEFSSTEYRGSGFAFEAFEGNRTGRIKFRGYLKRNNESKLVYAQIRFLCLFFSKTFDHQRLFDVNLMAKELSNEKIGSIEDMLENKIEQFAQIKGTFKVEQEEENELFFLGTIGRRFLPEKSLPKRKVVKICGFDKEGFGFQIGLVKSETFKFRYGFMTKHNETFKLMEKLTLTDECIEGLPTLTPLIDSYEFDVKFAGDQKDYKIVIRRWNDEVKELEVNGVKGLCFVIEETFEEVEVKRCTQINEQKIRKTANLVVSLDENCASLTELTGGKGASLAQLKKLSYNTEWTVPNGVVVTTKAYQLQKSSIFNFDEKLEEFERKIIARENVEKTCQQFVDWFSSTELHESITKELIKKMEIEFGSNWERSLFAVRSSAKSEDSAEMSAAGQMTTYLGVSGLQKIVKAVVKCWASQFAFVPVEYKRGYSQQIDCPMAVVIQKMVNSESAGVIFTANPVDGDERLLTITSNFGLGESVVSASAEPDTYTLQVDIEANSYLKKRKIASIAKKVLGKKGLVTRLNLQTSEKDAIEKGTTNEIHNSFSEKQSLSDEDIIHLGNIALDIASHYGNPRDIEWGIVSNQIFIFQSRPITNIDSNFTTYELSHEMDTAHFSEQEIYSRAHVGENMPGASSWLSSFLFINGINFIKQEIRIGVSSVADFNPFKGLFGVFSGQIFFNMRSGPFLQIFMDYPNNDFSIASVFAFFGHHIKDEDVLESFRTAPREKLRNWRFKLFMPFSMIYMLFINQRKIPYINRLLFQENFADICTPMKRVPLKEKLEYLCNYVVSKYVIMEVHGPASFSSMIKTMILRSVLKKVEKSNEDLDDDMNLLISHCNDVVSAEIPKILKDIAQAIQNKELFAKLSDDEAVELLKNVSSSEPVAAGKFVAFLQKHGHRCYRELDPMYPTWNENPTPCIQVIKSLLSQTNPQKQKQNLSFDEVLGQLKAQLTGFRKFIIKHCLLPWVRNAVGHREITKSALIKFQEGVRMAFRQISKEMVQDGILPEAELFYYLKLSEITQLVTGERNPVLIMKAKQRRRIYPTLNALKFTEFVKGFRMAPKPVKTEVIQMSEDNVCLKGTAVNIGSVKGRVCVAETIGEAVNIKPGDILLTYSTDIGWSPYFPLISGIVTEIGGTISHGAVIAREFGIPCLIAVEDVCQHFKTGDIAYLDTKTGTIVKVKE